MPPFGPRPPLGPPVYYSGPPMMPFAPMMSTPNVPQNVINPQTITSIPQTRTLSSLKTIPLTKTVSKSPKIDVVKKENKLINPRELLIAVIITILMFINDFCDSRFFIFFSKLINRKGLNLEKN